MLLYSYFWSYPEKFRLLRRILPSKIKKLVYISVVHSPLAAIFFASNLDHFRWCDFCRLLVCCSPDLINYGTIIKRFLAIFLGSCARYTGLLRMTNALSRFHRDTTNDGGDIRTHSHTDAGSSSTNSQNAEFTFHVAKYKFDIM